MIFFVKQANNGVK